MRTLVLNAGYEPLAVVSFKRALLLVMNEKATVILHDEDNPVHGTSGEWVRPSVILLSRYVRMPRVHQVPVSRRGVLRRDEHRCAYCGKSAATIDHAMTIQFTKCEEPLSSAPMLASAVADVHASRHRVLLWSGSGRQRRW